MDVTEILSGRTARCFFGRDMAESALFTVASGEAAVFSSRCPGKQSANEDAALLLPCGDDACVLAVADGVGGSRAGMEASRLATRSLKQAIERALEASGELREGILSGFETANREVLAMGVGAATTLAVVEVRGAKVRPYHVGDSLILVGGQRGKIKLQTMPHSPVGYGVEAGLLDEGEALHHKERHVVLNVIGSEDMRIEVGSFIDLARRDTVVLATDGLSDNLRTTEIVDTVRKGPLESAAGRLASESSSRMRIRETGRPDDLTFIVFRLKVSTRLR